MPGRTFFSKRRGSVVARCIADHDVKKDNLRGQKTITYFITSSDWRTAENGVGTKEFIIKYMFVLFSIKPLYVNEFIFVKVRTVNRLGTETRFK